MLRTLSRFTRRIVQTFAPPPLECQNAARPNNRFCPTLEMLGDRVVPANLGWTNSTGNGLFDTAANWRDLGTGAPGTIPPTVNDSLTFDGTLTNTNLTNLHGFGLSESVADFASIQFINGYSGTVTIAPDGTPGLTTITFTLTSGAIAQTHVGETTPIVSSTNLTVLGLFTWTGGTLNSTPSNATVNIYGTGNPAQPNTITLPGAGNTITTGSTLNFASLGAATLTTITGGGTLLFNGTSTDGIFVRQDAKVERVQQVGSVGVTQWINSVDKTLTLDLGSYWGYVGTGTGREGLRVINNGGKFYLSGRVTLEMTGGNATTPVYTQSGGTWLFQPSLQIMSGCVMDVSASKGVQINGGFVHVFANTTLGINDQVATIKGTYTMAGGSIGFPSRLTIGNENAWFKFKVDGNVNWSGGDFVPGVNGAANHAGQADKWIITGTLTVDTGNPVKPKIRPVALYVPEGQQAAGTWNVIESATTAGDTPTVEAGWTVEPIMVDGVKKGYRVKK